MLGHPRRKPRRTAFSRVENFGLPNNLCANRTAFTRVCTECINAAIAVGSIASCALLGMSALVVTWSCVIGNIHRSVDMFLGPTKIIFPLYCTSTWSLWNMTTHPALQSGRMPNKDAIAKSGITWPVSGCGSPGTTSSHVCVERTCLPLGRLTVRGSIATQRFGIGTPSWTKMDVATVSAMPCDGLMSTRRGLLAS
jgi:hypothetical protein